MVELNIYEIIMQVINFLILLYILKKLLYKPLIGFLDEREKTIKSSLEKSQKERKQAEEYLNKQQVVLAEAKKEALQIKYEAEHSGQLEREKIIIEAGKQTEKMINQAREELTIEVNNARQELKKEIAVVSLAVASKFLKKNIDKKTQEESIRQTMEEINA